MEKRNALGRLTWLGIAASFVLNGCMVVPKNSVDNVSRGECDVDSKSKTLVVVNGAKGNVNMYPWPEKIAGVITMPISAVVSTVYVVGNNAYHGLEKAAKCNGHSSTAET